MFSFFLVAFGIEAVGRWSDEGQVQGEGGVL